MTLCNVQYISVLTVTQYLNISTATQYLNCLLITRRRTSSSPMANAQLAARGTTQPTVAQRPSQRASNRARPRQRIAQMSEEQREAQRERITHLANSTCNRANYYNKDVYFIAQKTLSVTPNVPSDIILVLNFSISPLLPSQAAANRSHTSAIPLHTATPPSHTLRTPPEMPSLPCATDYL